MNWRSGKRKINREVAEAQAFADYVNNVDKFIASVQTTAQSLHDSFGLIGEAMAAVSASVGRIEPQAAKPDFPVTPTEMK